MEPFEDATLRMENAFVRVQPVGTMTAARFLDIPRHVHAQTDVSGDTPLLWDLTQANPGDLGSMPELTREMTAIRLQAHGNAWPGGWGRTAFLVGSDLGYGLSRTAASWAEIPDRPFRVFRQSDEAAATAWLREETET